MVKGNCSDWSRYGLGEDGIESMVRVASLQTPGAEQGSHDGPGLAALCGAGTAADLAASPPADAGSRSAGLLSAPARGSIMKVNSSGRKRSTLWRSTRWHSTTCSVTTCSAPAPEAGKSPAGVGAPSLPEGVPGNRDNWPWRVLLYGWVYGWAPPCAGQSRGCASGVPSWRGLAGWL